MNLSTVDQIIVVLYLAAIMSIGFAMKRKAAKGMSSYFLGGRQLPWWALAMSGSSSYFDITGTMWIVSTFIALGLKGMWVHMLWGFPITALLGYGAIGMGKFGAIFLPFSPITCAFLILGVTGLYVIIGGFHGIVRVEIVQTIVLSAGAIAFAVIGYLHFDAAAFAAKVPATWG